MIETARLILMPLTYGQLIKYTACDGSLERELQLNKSSRKISPELKEALEQTILPNVADTTKNFLFNTLWTAISKEHRQMIGDLCIIGAPNTEGEIEIGYGTYEEFQGKGYMTEMVGGIVSWARMQSNIKSIRASTEKTNAASYNVLLKNRFFKTAETENEFKWRLVLHGKDEA